MSDVPVEVEGNGIGTIPAPLRILLIEDNRGDALLLEETLHETGLTFELCRTELLQEGIDRAQQQAFDLVMLDLSLPDSAGNATIARAGKAFWKTPLVILTSLDDDQMGLRALQFGAQDYLVKSQVTTPLLLRSLRYAKARHREREMLLYASLVDDLTGLYNRRGFVTVAKEELASEKKRGLPFLMAFADLDGLKKVNDVHGHAAGDWAISCAAEALKQALKSDDVIGRIGGDEFVILSSRAEEGAEERIRDSLSQVLARLNAEAKRPYEISISLGFYRPKSEEADQLDLLLGRADEALYEAKRNRYASQPR